MLDWCSVLDSMQIIDCNAVSLIGNQLSYVLEQALDSKIFFWHVCSTRSSSYLGFLWKALTAFILRYPVPPPVHCRMQLITDVCALGFALGPYFVFACIQFQQYALGLHKVSTQCVLFIGFGLMQFSKFVSVSGECDLNWWLEYYFELFTTSA